MAGEVERLSGKLGIDTTDFKTALAAANRELRVLESGFKASAAALGDWTQDATGLESRVKSLTSQIDVQKLKVAALAAEHKRLVEENGANSRAAQDAEIKLNKETETLGKMENELGNTETALEDLAQGQGEAGSAAEDSGEDAEESGSKWEKLVPILKGVGVAAVGLVTAMAAVGAAAIAAVAGISELVFSASEAAAELVDMSTKTGLSTTQLQELDFIAGQVGTDLDTITSSQARLIRTMAAAQGGAKGQQEAFQALGISVTNADGSLRDSNAVFNQTIDALGRIRNPAERDALAMEIFGKSAQELNPLIKAGSDEMARLAQEAHNVGAVMSEEDVAALEAFDDTLASLTAGLKGTLGTLASAFLPGFQAVFDQAGGYLKTFSEIVSGADGDFGKIAEGLTGLVTQIATDLAAQAPQMLSAGLEIVQSILDAIIAALPSMLTAATEIITALINFIAQALPSLLQAGVQILLTIVTAIIENLPMLIDAALQAILALANGLAAALPTLIPAVVQAVITIVTTLAENIPLLIDAALQLILGLAEGLIIALPVLIAALPEVIDTILNALIDALPLIFDAAGELIGMLAIGIVAAIPVLIVAMGELIARLGNTLAEFIETLPELGRRFVQGLADGISNAAGFLYDAVTEMIQNAIATIQTLLSFGGPSNEPKSLGLQNPLQSAQQALVQISAQLAQTALGGSGAGGNSSIQNDQFQFFAPVIIQDVQPSGLADRLKGRRY